MSAIDNAKAHFRDQGQRRIEVPEWGDERGPLVVYAEPLTLAERRRLFQRNKGDDVGLSVDLLIVKARDADGKPLFSLDDKQALLNGVDPAVVARVAADIIAAPSLEDAEKN